MGNSLSDRDLFIPFIGNFATRKAVVSENPFYGNYGSGGRFGRGETGKTTLTRKTMWPRYAVILRNGDRNWE